MAVEKFVKGSVWETGDILKIRGVTVPVGTKFQVVYPRRRETNLVAARFPDITLPAKKENLSTISRRRSTKGRFHLADAMINADKLVKSKLISVGDQPREYFIRDKKMSELWAGGFQSPARFAPVPFREGNHYVSKKTALIGIIGLLFKKWKSANPNEVIFEIVGYNPFLDRVEEVIDLHPVWWSNVVRLGKHSRKNDLSFKDAVPVDVKGGLRKLANAVGEANWDFFAVISSSKPRTVIINELGKAGVRYLCDKTSVILLGDDHDRVMAKLIVADDILIIPL